MLNFDRIDVSEGIDVKRTSTSKECDNCHYWYFSNYSFKFQRNICIRCHDLLMMYMNYSRVAILNIKGSDQAIKLMQNVDLTKKKAEHYKA